MTSFHNGYPELIFFPKMKEDIKLIQCLSRFHGELRESLERERECECREGGGGGGIYRKESSASW